MHSPLSRSLDSVQFASRVVTFVYSHLSLLPALLTFFSMLVVFSHSLHPYFRCNNSSSRKKRSIHCHLLRLLFSVASFLLSFRVSEKRADSINWIILTDIAHSGRLDFTSLRQHSTLSSESFTYLLRKINFNFPRLMIKKNSPSTFTPAECKLTSTFHPETAP